MKWFTVLHFVPFWKTSNIWIWKKNIEKYIINVDIFAIALNINTIKIKSLFLCSMESVNTCSFDSAQFTMLFNNESRVMLMLERESDVKGFACRWIREKPRKNWPPLSRVIPTCDRKKWRKRSITTYRVCRMKAITVCGGSEGCWRLPEDRYQDIGKSRRRGPESLETCQKFWKSISRQAVPLDIYFRRTS